MTFDLRLCALDITMIDAWRTHFPAELSVTIHHGSILELRGDAVISPANSRGLMRGGIDLAYTRFFGEQIERNVQAAIARDHGGELPVGTALIVDTGDPRIPKLISAPTMRTPGLRIADTTNVYLAFRAALLAVAKYNETPGPRICVVLSPALGTGVGAVPPESAARQMWAAYAEVVLQDPKWREHLSM